ncbi:uncharacterized protein KY384_002492 [Bacidia gigantensis]|uniref:uncharacterized protein n=1 Tax=Bacidia gigantensis TaxID=2732470 RepID=UPI001D044C57|nr:uncharacterized protein KY384_002492 [Bacidia gigantensis]KAG8532615.1 hypothetical protein KY384_002492 [Bacidia gigantensis]
MSSSVFFRFKSQKEPSRVTFDGTGISVFELKRDIIAQSKLGDGSDFELIINSEDTNEEYDDDTAIIPRSTTVIAKRLPASKPGRGGAARYVSGKMPQSSKNAYRQETSSSKNTTNQFSHGLGNIRGVQSEEERIKSTLQMGADDWARQQQQMANAAPVHRTLPMKGKPQNVPDHPPASTYVCHRCNEKGHWIQECPTNNDPAFDNRPRIKRTTGIPKSFLKTVERPTAIVNDGTIDDAKQPSGVMVNSEGEYVVAEPDQAAWDRYQVQAKISVAAQNVAAKSTKDLQDLGLECQMDKRLFVDPTKTPCCGRTFCHECIQTALLDNDLRCPQCSTDNVPIDDLIPDVEMAARVRKYEEGKAAARPVEIPENPVFTKSEDVLPSFAPSESKSPLAKLSVPEPSLAIKESRKRPAELELENTRSGQSPKKEQPARIANKTPSYFDQSRTKDRTIDPATSANGSQINSNLNPMSFPNMNGFMGIPVSMGMQNSMMMIPPATFTSQNWNHSWGMPYSQPNLNMNMGAPQNSAPYTNGFNQPNMRSNGSQSIQSQWNFDNNGNKIAYGQFANQQRSNNEEESAYFRKPVNPNRQQNRRNWNQNRPADFREI